MSACFSTAGGASAAGFCSWAGASPTAAASRAARTKRPRVIRESSSDIACGGLDDCSSFLRQRNWETASNPQRPLVGVLVEPDDEGGADAGGRGPQVPGRAEQPAEQRLVVRPVG